jgi:hypothetical protein
MESVLVHVTRVPLVTVTVPGENELLFIEIASAPETTCPPVDDPPVADPPVDALPPEKFVSIVPEVMIDPLPETVTFEDV